MLKVEMIRCYVTSPNPEQENPEGARQVRYIPKEIFRLWKFLMVKVKSFTIVDESEAFWVDKELYSKEKPGYGDHQVDEVVQIYFRYFKNVEGGRPVIRYFPSKYYDQIMQFFMMNFSEEHIQKDAERTDGYFVLQR